MCTEIEEGESLDTIDGLAHILETKEDKVDRMPELVVALLQRRLLYRNDPNC